MSRIISISILHWLSIRSLISRHFSFLRYFALSRYCLKNSNDDLEFQETLGQTVLLKLWNALLYKIRRTKTIRIQNFILSFIGDNCITIFLFFYPLSRNGLSCCSYSCCFYFYAFYHSHFVLETFIQSFYLFYRYPIFVIPIEQL